MLYYQACQVPNIDRASPGHLEYYLWRPVNMRLYEWAGLLPLSDPCLAEVTQNREPITFSSSWSTECSALMDNTCLVNLLPRAGILGFHLREVGQYAVILQTEHQVVGL